MRGFLLVVHKFGLYLTVVPKNITIEIDLAAHFNFGDNSCRIVLSIVFNE